MIVSHIEVLDFRTFDFGIVSSRGRNFLDRVNTGIRKNEEGSEADPSSRKNMRLIWHITLFGSSISKSQKSSWIYYYFSTSTDKDLFTQQKTQ